MVTFFPIALQAQEQTDISDNVDSQVTGDVRHDSEGWNVVVSIGQSEQLEQLPDNISFSTENQLGDQGDSTEEPVGKTGVSENLNGAEDRIKEESGSLSGKSSVTTEILSIFGPKTDKELSQIKFEDGKFWIKIETETLKTAPSTGKLDSESSSELSASSESVPEKSYIVFQLNQLTPDEVSLLYDAGNSYWDQWELLEAALIAEGLDKTSERDVYIKKYRYWQKKMVQELSNRDDPKWLTRYVFEFMHRYILTGRYSLNCSSLVSSLEHGEYNCVSATILFNSLAEHVGLLVTGLETTGHAKSRVKYENDYLDIETTCSQWSSLPDKLRPLPQSQRSSKHVFSSNVGDSVKTLSSGESENDTEDSGKDSTDSEVLPLNAVKPASHLNETLVGNKDNTTDPTALPAGYSYTSHKNPMREITEVQLVATIYYNRGVDFYQAKQYDHAVAAYVKAAYLDPGNKTIMGNLKATLNNWAIQMVANHQDYENAIRLTENGLKIDPDFVEFKTNLPVFYQHWITELKRNNQFDEMSRVLMEYRQRFPDL